ncbi:MAG: hypothetical protein MJZ50_03600 [Treponema sp.]|nr:hypothetical protein [Treponema sp.]
MKKSLLFALIAFPVASAFAFEFNGIVSDGTSMKINGGKTENKELKQTETFTGSFKAPINNEGNIYFTAEGSVQHKLEKNWEADTSKNSAILDCTLFQLFSSTRLNQTDTLQFTAGRAFTSDLSGLVFAQPSDGVLVKYANPRIDCTVYGGYSGLQNSKNVSILTSKGVVWAPEDEKDLYDFAAPYANGSLCLSFPYLFLNQTISIEGMGVWNVSGPADLSDDDKRIYGTLLLTGPLSNVLFYTASATMQTEDFGDKSLLGQLGLNAFLPWKNSTINLKGIYASGDKSGLKPFVGFTKQTACGSRSEPVLSGVAKFGGSASILPVDLIYLSAGVDAVYKLGEDSTEYYGTQVTGGIKFNFASDFDMNLSVTDFIGKESEESKLEIALGVNLAF